MTDTAHYCAEQYTRSGALRSSLRISNRYASYSAHLKNIRQTEGIGFDCRQLSLSPIFPLFNMHRRAFFFFFSFILFSNKSRKSISNSCENMAYFDDKRGTRFQIQFFAFEWRILGRQKISYWLLVSHQIRFLSFHCAGTESRVPVLVVSNSRHELASCLSASSSFLDIYNPP